MRAGVVKRQAMFFVLAADQQQEVHRSRHTEALACVQRHRVEKESKPFQKSLMAIGQCVQGRATEVWQEQKTKVDQHADSLMGIPYLQAQHPRNVARMRKT